MNNDRKTALVTGANRGIGLAIASGLAATGKIHVLLGSRDLEAGKAAADKIGNHVQAVALDLGRRDVLTQQFQALTSAYGPVDILINNAGVLAQGSVLEVSGEDFEHSLRINLIAAFDLARMALPAMIDNNYGRIVNVSSGWGSFDEGLGGPAAYSISKAGLNALTLSLAQSVPAGVKVNAICPGWVRTRMGGQDALRSPEEGADTAIWLATLPDNGPSGGFFRDRKPIQW
jgi:NAD(P)-dependent dehydrogenase (short-subunit alcohol dehydrogenase family)